MLRAVSQQRPPVAAAAVVALGLLTALGGAAPAARAATRLCGPLQTTAVEHGEYIVQNNVWGASTPQCLSVGGTSFKVVSSGHRNTGATPASYPSIFKGCHWGRCTTNSGFPLRVGAMPRVTSSWSTAQPDSGKYEVAYDLWFDKRPATRGQPDGAELMIWLNSRGVRPAGQPVAAGVPIGGATWDVWYARTSWNYIAYVRTSPATSVSGLDLRAFTQDAVGRGYINNSWYLLDAEAGFEIWQGGAGLATTSFSVN
jgi:Glycosyl hydrolase family 12